MGRLVVNFFGKQTGRLRKAKTLGCGSGFLAATIGAESPSHSALAQHQNNNRCHVKTRSVFDPELRPKGAREYWNIGMVECCV